MTAVIWLDINRRFLVVERVDRGSPSGVREVSLTLATSDLRDVDVAELPTYEESSLPEFTDETQPIIKQNPIDQLLASLGLPAGGGSGGGGSNTLPWDGGAVLPDCCEEPPVSVTEVTPVLPFSDLVIYLYDGSDAIFVDWIRTPLTWEWLSDSPGGLVDTSAPLFRTDAADEPAASVALAFRAASAYTSDAFEGEFRGEMYESTDGGTTWSAVTKPGVIAPSVLDYQNFHWAVYYDGNVYAGWTDDEEGTFPGASYKVFRVPSSWEPKNLPADASALGSWADIDDAGRVFHVYHTGGVPRTAGAPVTIGFTINSQWTPGGNAERILTVGDEGPLVVPEDYSVLNAWGENDRIIFAMHEGYGVDYEPMTGTGALITYLDKISGSFNWDDTGDPDWQRVYVAADGGRPIGLIRKTDTPTLFAGFSGGVILRSTDNGSSWVEMDKFEPFSEAHAIAYDQGNDSLWAVGLDENGDAVLHAWTAASASAGTSIDMTRNLGEVGAITASPGRNIGHLGMIVREHGATP